MPTKFILKQNSPNGTPDANATLDEYVFDGNMFTIGSDEGNSLVLPKVATEQAVIVREGDHLTLINSADGTGLNGQKLRREAIQPLAEGDEIRIENYVILVVGDQYAQSSETARIEIPSTLNNGFIENQETLNSATDKTLELPVKTAAQPETMPVAATGNTRNFAAVLDTLRTEEDSFYFIIKDAERETGRLLLERAETPIGINAKNELLFEIERITTVLAIARKDWSGILIESQRRNSVFVNGEPLETTRRLRNDDRVSFPASIKPTLVLHEPSLLVALEPLLTARATSAANAGGANSSLVAKQPSALEAKQKVSLFERSYFGYFSFVETISMFIGTLILAVLFFLFFEYIFS